MCGLLAFSAPSPFIPLTISSLFSANQSRGTDSAGFFSDSNPLSPDNIIKELGPFSENLAKKFNPIPAKLCIGHTRAATIGDVNIQNAHPFQFNHVIGAHNGTLTNYHQLIEKYNHLNPEIFNLTNLNIDSKLIFAAINEFNDLRVLSDLQGAAAIIWRDFRNNLPYLNVWRNNERPLHYGFSNIANEMFVSSEAMALSSIGCVNIMEFDTYTHYQIHEGQIINLFKTH